MPTDNDIFQFLPVKLTGMLFCYRTRKEMMEVFERSFITNTIPGMNYKRPLISSNLKGITSGGIEA